MASCDERTQNSSKLTKWETFLILFILLAAKSSVLSFVCANKRTIYYEQNQLQWSQKIYMLLMLVV